MFSTVQHLWFVTLSPAHVTAGGEDRQIPHLYQLFEEFPEVAVNIDIKTNNDVLIQQVKCCR